MRSITISVFKNEKSNSPKETCGTWDEIVAALSQRGHKSRPSKSGPAIGFYELKPETTRASNNVRQIHAVALDLDNCTSYEDIAEAFARYEHLYHTTHSHSSACPKGRVILPLTRAAMPEEWPDVWRGANQLAGQVADTKTDDLSRLFYMPSCPVERANEARIEHRTGRWLDTDEMIRIGQQSETRNRGEANRLPTASLGSFDVACLFDETKVKAALERVDWDNRDQWLKAGMALHSNGLGESTYALWCQYSKRSAKFNEPKQRATWDGFRVDRDKRITLGSLFHMTGYAEPIAPPSTPNLSELGLAERFLLRHAPDVRYVIGENVFLVWDGRLWRRDPEERLVTEKMTETVKAVQRDEVPALMGRDTAAAKATSMWAIKSAERHSTIDAALRFLKKEPTIAIKPSTLDAESNFLQVENGIVDLKSGELLAATRDMLHTKVSNARYVGGAKCPRWKAFLKDVTQGDAELERFLQRAVGYSLSGTNTLQQFYFLYGLGANGKSVFLRVLRELAGSYATSAKADSFMLHQRSGQAANPDIVAMTSARVVCISEIPKGQRLDTALIKTLTGGEESAARQLYGRQFTFTPRFKLWFAGNHQPEIRDRDHGIWRRMLLVPFTAQIALENQDPELIEKLREDLPGILNWAIEGYQNFVRDGMRPPKAITDAVEVYKGDEDILGDWMSECCDKEPTGTASRAALRASYINHCARSSMRTISDKAFVASLRERGYDTDTKTGGVRGYRGIRLREIPNTARLVA
jgi:putative DNA primase/helicase